MTLRLALVAAGIVLLLGADLALNGGGIALFLARRFLDLLDWVTFWR